MRNHRITRGLYALTAAALVITSVAAYGKPRLIKVRDDGSTQEITDQVVASEYLSTLVNGFTPTPFTWAGRKWRVNAGSTWAARMYHSVQISPTGKKIRFEIQNTENDNSSNDSDKATIRRSEFSASLYGDPTRLPNGQALWGAFSFNHHSWADSEGMAKLTGGVYGQIHMGSTFGGSPAVAFRRKADGRFRITTRGEFSTSNTTRFEAPLSFDEVHDIVYRVVLHPTNGSLRVWLNSALVVDVNGVSIGSSYSDSYWNVGVYFAGGITSPVVADYANHVYPGLETQLPRVGAAPSWPQD